MPVRTKRIFTIPKPHHESARERYDLQLKLLHVAQRISEQGIHFDVAAAEKMLAEAKARQDAARDAFLQVTGLPLSALGKAQEGKTKAVKDYFWKTLDAPPLIKAKRSNLPQFNTALLVEYLRCLPPEKGGRASMELLAMRAAKKQAQFLTTYLAFAYAGGGKIYGRFNSLGTIGERWSSSASMKRADGEKFRLNFQNVPKKDVKITYQGKVYILAQSLRKLFLPPPGMVWLKFDYEAQEAKLLAWQSAAKKLISWIAEDKKLHTLNAIGLFWELALPDYDTFMKNRKAEAKKKEAGLPYDSKWDDAYDAAKGCMYAMAYQVAKGDGNDQYRDVYKTLVKLFPEWDQAYVNSLAPRYFQLHPEIRELQLRVIKEVQEQGCVTHPIFGGRVYVEDAPRGYNQGINYLMQSGGGHVFNRALVALEPELDWTTCGIMALIHDEIAAWCPADETDKWGPLIAKHMAVPFQIFGKTYSLSAEWHAKPTWQE